MGGNPERETPFFFQKPADAIVPNGGRVAYPPLTENLQHEVEFVIAIGKQGFNIPVKDAGKYVYGVALGIDLTRRDRQFEARDSKRPWEIGKSFDMSAPCSAIKPLDGAPLPTSGRIELCVNDQVRQQGDLGQMIWNADEIICQLSRGYQLKPGDLIFTGTPAGVGAIVRGDRIVASLEGLEKLTVDIV